MKNAASRWPNILARKPSLRLNGMGVNGWPLGRGLLLPLGLGVNGWPFGGSLLLPLGLGMNGWPLDGGLEPPFGYGYDMARNGGGYLIGGVSEGPSGGGEEGYLFGV